jgi:peptidoglycan/LPS O-acetylase OafA/YrhL
MRFFRKVRYRVPVRRHEEYSLGTMGAIVPPPRPLIRPYMPELDSIRGIAVLMVLFLHGVAWPLNAALSRPGRWLLSISQHGGAGVNLFFVLSGFLITGILLDGKSKTDYYRRFYTRRALRILPALCATLLVLFIGGWINWRFALVSLAFLANTAPLLGVPLQYGPLWSLAVEEHFYMLWPALVRRFSSTWQLILLVGIILFSPVLRAIAFAHLGGPYGGRPLYTWFNLDGLALGAILAIWLRHPSFRRVHLSRVALPIFMTGVTLYAWYVGRPQAPAAFADTACAVASVGFLSCMLLVGTSNWSALVDIPILKFLGVISYGLYLIHVLAFRITEILLSHFPMLVAAEKPTLAMLLRFVGGSSLAIAAAFISRRSLEEHFLRRGRDHRPGFPISSKVERRYPYAGTPSQFPADQVQAS